MTGKPWLRVLVAGILLVLPWLVGAPRDAHPALAPVLWGRYSLLFVVSYLFHATVIVPWLLELAFGSTHFSRRWIRRTGYAWFCLALAAGGVEALFRVAPSLIPNGTLTLLPDLGRSLFRGYFKGQMPDPELGFRLRPGFTWDEAGHAWLGDLAAQGIALPTRKEAFSLDLDPPCFNRLDERGYRGVVDDGVRFSTREERPRILFLGDSFLFCARLAAEHIWCASACRALGATAVNLGVFAYGVPQEAIVLAREIEYYRPQLVVLCIFDGNDLENGAEWQEWRASGMPYWKWDSRRRGWLECSPVLGWAAHRFTVHFGNQDVEALPANPLQPYRGEIAGASVVMGFAPAYLAMLETSPEEARRHAGWGPTLAGIEQCEALCRQHGARLLVAMLPSKASVYAWHLLERVDPMAVLEAARGEPLTPERARRFVERARMYRNGFPAALQAAMEQRGRPYLDFRPRFFAEVENGAPQLYRAFDTHWNPAGHQLAADILVDYLASHPELLAADRQ
ncbi:hypothetical protein HS125_13605 [bacterium]|nr:hypothetical protein [bacterium]